MDYLVIHVSDQKGSQGILTAYEGDFKLSVILYIWQHWCTSSTRRISLWDFI